MTRAALTAELKKEAEQAGFQLVGVCPAVAPPGATLFDDWLDAGYAGQMHYFENRREAYQHPTSILAGARSILMLAIDYRTTDPEMAARGQGRISRYASGQDYHDLIRWRLNQLAAWLIARSPGATARGVVDTAPLLERDFATLSGLGWIGKHTLLLNRERGSWFFLAALLTSVELEVDSPFATDHCGSCRACLDACPTNAFVAPYQLDARRCISYLTIELRGPIPRELRAAIGDWLFGCDVCQEVCPWNSKSRPTDEPAFQPAANANPVALGELLRLDEQAFRRRFRGSPLWRAKRRGLLRNAAIVLGNQCDPAAVDVLSLSLADEEPLVRGASAWALGRIGGVFATAALEQRKHLETDAEVQAEIELALRDAAPADGASDA